MYSNPTIEIPKDEPFKNCRLKRKQIAVNLSRLVGSFTDPAVVCINAPWGSGKTTFIAMWQQMLVNNGHVCLSFNAWRNDFAADPLVAFITEFDEYVDAHYKGEASAGLRKIGLAAKNLGQRLAPLAIKLLAARLFKDSEVMINALKPPADDSGKITGDALADAAKDAIKEHRDRKGTVEEFRDVLTKFIASLRNEETDQEQTRGDVESLGVSEHSPTATKPVVFFIDELDRCRPTFAIELLETIKHLFDVPGLVFVLAMDTVQLSHSVRAVYGSGFGARGYLRRFIDVDYQFPRPDGRAFISFALDHFQVGAVMKRQGLLQFNSDALMHSIYSMLVKGAEMFGLELRDMIQCVREFSILCRLVHQTNYEHLDYGAFMVVFKRKHCDLLEQFSKREVGIEAVLDAIRETEKGAEWLKSVAGRMIEVYLLRAHQTPVEATAMIEAWGEQRTQLREQDDASFDERKRYDAYWSVASKISHNNPHQELMTALAFANDVHFS
ncbi:MAG TPA: P-loop NTPase fold protein [Candidatus Kapabacteria bacterium]|nr:P-loop NTPase fold protein [Candidatus Kapabacteria bacterium]